MLGTRTILGLAIDEFGIVAAEVSAHTGRPEIRHVGQLTFDEKLSSDNVNDRAGQLKAFLRTNHFTSKHAVIGIPLKWIVAKEMTAPAAANEAVAGMLGIQAERAFSLNANELIFDYHGSTSTSEPSRVMLLAARRQMIEHIKEMAASAGLHLQAVTVSALAFSGSADSSRAHFGLYARPAYCEFWSQSNGRLHAVRHIPIPSTNGSGPDHTDVLTSAIQKQVMLTPQQDQTPPYEVTLYDASGLSTSVISRLDKQLRPQITLSDGRSSVLAGTSGQGEHAEAIAAAAVAMAAARTAGPQVDFLNPRIGIKKVDHRKKAITYIAGGVAACVLIVGLIALDWHLKTSQIASYKAQLEEAKPQIDNAKLVVDRVAYAKSWLSQEPKFLERMRELTLMFPQKPNSAWVGNLTLTERTGGSLTGKSSDQATALDIIRQLREDKKFFTDIQRNYLRQTKEGFEYSINFKFAGDK
jgi:hypothetical protein